MISKKNCTGILKLSSSFLFAVIVLVSVFVSHIQGQSATVPPSDEATSIGSAAGTTVSTNVGTDFGTGVGSDEKGEVLGPNDPAGCYSNLTIMFNDVKYGDPFSQSQFIVCPNTTYSIGLLDGQSNDCCDEPGKHHPLVLRQNSEFLCGDDGKATNNCILEGGQFNAYSLYFDWLEPLDNVIVRGFTFANSPGTSIFVSNSGDILFEDCVITENEGDAPVFLAQSGDWYESNRRMDEDPFNKTKNELSLVEYLRYHHTDRYAKALSYKLERVSSMSSSRNNVDLNVDVELKRDDIANFHNTQRYLQTAIEERHLKVVFDKCLFSNNVVGPQDEVSTFEGVVYASAGYHDVTFTKCMFVGNKYNIEGTKEGYAIRMEEGNELTIEDSCFMENDFLGPGTVIMNGTSETTFLNNYVLPNDNLKCQFVYEERLDECIEVPDATSCALIGESPVAAPVAPAPTPAAAPTEPAPTSGVITPPFATSIAMFASIFYTGMFLFALVFSA